jgi:hypothetical protein
MLSDYYKWLKRDWAKAGFILAIFLFVFLFVLVRKNDMVIFILLIQTPLYMLHQTEEYVFPGGFAKYFNKDIFKLETVKGPVNENFVFYINILLIWLLLPLFGLLSINNYQFGLWIPYFSFFAGIAHVLLAARAKKLYNPGLIVSLIINIPVGFWSIQFLINRGIINDFFLNPHIVIGFGLNALLPMFGVIVLRKYKKSQGHK